VTLAERLAAFAADLEFDTLPDEVVASVRLRALDVLGLGLAASTYDFAKPVIAAAADGGPCTIMGSASTASPAGAALVNGTLAHGLDFDDTHAASITHASAVVVPSVLAIGESRGIAGPEVITAVVAGYEAIARLGMAAPGAFHARGWHATSVCGVFAAALAAGKLLRLDATRLTHALGLAGSFASGVMEFLEDGSAVKRLHAGWAAHAGVVAATLAAGGLTGPATVLEGRFGFYRTFVGVAPLTEVFETLGRRWETPRISFKPYPCCHLNHAYIDCALRLRREQRVEADAIVSIECRVPEGEIPIVCEPRAAKLRPRTTYEAQFSLPYTIAAAFLDWRVGLGTFTTARLADERLLGLAARVQHVVDPASTFPNGFPGWVRVRLTDGRVVEVREPDGRGGPARPLPSAAIVEKFRENAGRVLLGPRRDELERAVLALESARDIRKVLVMCRAES
jgi:2-methylcitrate dehydratase PrpD